MPSNELVERLVAAAWVQYPSAFAEGPNPIFANPILASLRAQVGFLNRIIMTTAPTQDPTLLLTLDRELARDSTVIVAYPVGSQMRDNFLPANVARVSYPWFQPFVEPLPATGSVGYSDILSEPCHMDWFGPNLGAPVWKPFGLSPGGPATPIPAGFDSNVINTIAFFNQGRMFNTQAPDPFTFQSVGQDFCVLVFKLPRQEEEPNVGNGQVTFPLLASGPFAAPP